MRNIKKIVFLTGTRADFGKLKSLIDICIKNEQLEVQIFATGMHMQAKYGYTVDEILKYGYKDVFKYINYTSETSMDQTLAKTIEGFSNYLREFKTDLIVVHGDRVEALAGAITGALNNILVAHIEGGEKSGTIDETIRHAVSKMSHSHFVANESAKKRLIQMGEISDSIFIIGSPDVDAMLSNRLPSIEDVKLRYGINYKDYSILMFHPVTTEAIHMSEYAKNLVDALCETDQKYIVIFPNNDFGSSDILREYERFKGNSRFKVFPSIRFEYFLVLLKNAQFIIGNSSAGIREAPYYGLPSINIGSRQNNRAMHDGIINCGTSREEILFAIEKAVNSSFSPIKLYGDGNSDQLFLNSIMNDSFWLISKQKMFKDIL